MANISKTYISGEIKVEALKNLNLKIEGGDSIRTLRVWKNDFIEFIRRDIFP